LDDLDALVLKNPIVDKILGVIYGNALGDAFGLSTEFLSKDHVTSLYGADDIPFPNYKKNAHNMEWKAGDWTDDTDQMICILDTILETKGQASEIIFAKKLKKWCKRGFPELGDYAGMGLGMTVCSVILHNDYLEDPHKAAESIWIQSGKKGAANGGIMRTSILGCLDYNDLNKVIENTLRICKVTHFDPRCLASCVAVTVTIASILQGAPTKTNSDIQKLIDITEEHALKYIIGEDQIKEFKSYIVRESSKEALYALKLDDESSIGYTLKCMGSAFWGLNSTGTFKETIMDLIKEGGDADTNGAVCGALYGARYGFQKLPKEMIDIMPNKTWLDKKIVDFLQLLGFVQNKS